MTTNLYHLSFKPRISLNMPSVEK